MDPEEDEIFTRKTSGNCECDPNFFEEKKQERGKKKTLEKEKGGSNRIEAIGQNFPSRQFLAHTERVVAFTMDPRTHGSVAHSLGMKNRSRGERRRSGKKKGGNPNRRNVELSTALIVSRSGPMV